MKIKSLFSLLIAMGCTAFNSFAYDFYVADFAITPGQTQDFEVDIYMEADEALGTGTGAISAKVELPAGFNWSSKDPVIAVSGTPQFTYNSAKTVLTLGALSSTQAAGKSLFAKFWLTPKSDMEATTMTVKGLKIDGNSVENKTVTISALSEVTIGAGGYSSFSSYAPVKVTGAKVMFGTLNGDVLTIAGDGDVVPANTGVILKGTEGATVTLEPAETAPTTESALAPAVLPTTVQANKTMVLSTVGGVTGFYVFSGTTIPGNKAYLPSIPSGSRVRIEEEGATGIESIEAETNGFNYNLMGQQVKSQKGIMIENGKKVIRF